MMKRLLCALTALALCLLPVCLAQGEAKEPVRAFLLESLKEGEACPARAWARTSRRSLRPAWRLKRCRKR